MADSSDLSSSIGSMHESWGAWHQATNQLNESKRRVSAALQESIGKVLPLAGIANVIGVRTGPNISMVPRRSMLDSSPATFGPDYYRVNGVLPSEGIVTLISPECEVRDQYIGFHAQIGSITLATTQQVIQFQHART